MHAQVVHLASEVFHYHANDRMKIRMRKFATEQWPDSIGKRVSQDLPLKVAMYHTLCEPCLLVLVYSYMYIHMHKLPTHLLYCTGASLEWLYTIASSLHALF